MASLLDANETARLNILPLAESMTLLFKFARHTVLLSVAQNQTLDEITELLLLALKSRAILKIGDYDIPDDKDELELGVLIDRKDPSKGWVLLNGKERGDTERSPVQRKKKKPTAEAEDTPGGLGLVDGSWIAVRVKTPNLIKSVEEVELKDSEDADMDLDPGWDVVVPKLEDEDEEEEEQS